MEHYSSCYNPPPIPDLKAHRDRTFAADDKELFLHVGHFISYYAAAEFALTMLLQTFTGRPHPAGFHILTRGMDAKIKVKRLKEAIESCGCTLDEGLQKRLNHFTKNLVSLRNVLVHSHLYWPEGGDLQMTSIGRPPIFAVAPLKAPKPRRTIPGLELYERGAWLCLFFQDLIAIEDRYRHNRAPKGEIGIDHYSSGLPTGDQQSPEKLARRVNAERRAQEPPSDPKSDQK